MTERPLRERFPAADRAALQRRGLVAVSVCDTARGASYHNEYARVPIRSASIIKVPLLLAALDQAYKDRRDLSPAERADAEAMIRRSDNNATTRFWRSLGPEPAVVWMRSVGGMQATRIAPENPNWWGYTRTTSRDMATVLGRLAAHTLLTPALCDYALAEMRRVIPSQRWGLPEVHAAPDRVAVKNGWYPEEDAGKVWRVHTVGVAPVGTEERRAVIAVLTRYPLELGMAYGQETCRRVAREVFGEFGVGSVGRREVLL